MNKILVVYLLRDQAGVKPFFDSLQRHPSGMEYDLLVIDKGQRAVMPFGMVNYKKVSIPDKGFNLWAFNVSLDYTQGYDYVCFHNSSSVILADDWLLKLWLALQLKNAGMAGATGSWESHSTLYGDPLYRLFIYHPFPSYHIRGTGFMMRTEVALMARPWWCWPHMKLNYMAECSRFGISGKVKSFGLDLMVVDKHSNIYHEHEWIASETYRIGTQKNLMIADNQTFIYDRSTPEERTHLTNISWTRTTYREEGFNPSLKKK